MKQEGLGALPTAKTQRGTVDFTHMARRGSGESSRKQPTEGKDGKLPW